MSNLDQIRTRLMTLNSSLRKMQESVAIQQPLPSWTMLQSHATVISNSFLAISEQLAKHQAELSSTEAFPLPQFPGRQSGFILETLLRTKLEPNVEEWRDQGIKTTQQSSNGRATQLSDKDRNELWQWAPSAANAEARKQKWGADYTLAEKQAGIETVVTGLRRQLNEPPDDADDEDEYDDDDDDDEEDDEDDISGKEQNGDGQGDGDKMNIDRPKAAGAGEPVTTSQDTYMGPQMPLESIHMFMTSGRIG